MFVLMYINFNIPTMESHAAINMNVEILSVLQWKDTWDILLIEKINQGEEKYTQCATFYINNAVYRSWSLFYRRNRFRDILLSPVFWLPPLLRNISQNLELRWDPGGIKAGTVRPESKSFKEVQWDVWRVI